MTPDDYPRFCTALGTLCEAFQFALSAEQIRRWFSIATATHADIVQFERGCYALLRGERDFYAKNPRLPDILRAGCDDDETLETRAVLAWQTVRRNLHPCNSVTFDDRVIHAVIVAMGGWVELTSGKITDENEHFVGREFMRLYRIYARLPDAAADAPDHLVGTIEHHNTTHGFLAHIPEPLRITCESSTSAKDQIGGSHHAEIGAEM